MGGAAFASPVAEDFALGRLLGTPVGSLLSAWLALRAGVAALGFTADIPRNPRKTGRPKERRFAPGRWVVERTHAHLGAFRAVRVRWCRLLDSYQAFLATAAAHRIIKQAGL